MRPPPRTPPTRNRAKNTYGLWARRSIPRTLTARGDEGRADSTHAESPSRYPVCAWGILMAHCAESPMLSKTSPQAPQAKIGLCTREFAVATPGLFAQPGPAPIPIRVLLDAAIGQGGCRLCMHTQSTASTSTQMGALRNVYVTGACMGCV